MPRTQIPNPDPDISGILDAFVPLQTFLGTVVDIAGIAAAAGIVLLTIIGLAGRDIVPSSGAGSGILFLWSTAGIATAVATIFGGILLARWAPVITIAATLGVAIAVAIGWRLVRTYR